MTSPKRTPKFVKKRGVIYVAGRMRGLYEFNFPEFLKAAKHLRQLGWEVICPAEHDLDMGFDPVGKMGTDAELEEVDFDMRGAASWDLQQLTQHSDAIALLPGWKQSAGARAEYAVAKWLGLDIYEYDRSSSSGLRSFAGRTVEL